MRNVMVIDDDLDFIGELKESLVLSGYSVSAADAATAMRKVARIRPDVILLDLKMEAVSGLDILERLRARVETRDIPVVVISGFFDEGRDYSLLNYFNISHYLRKPFAPFDLLRKIEAVTGKKRFRRSGE